MVNLADFVRPYIIDGFPYTWHISCTAVYLRNLLYQARPEDYGYTFGNKLSPLNELFQNSAMNWPRWDQLLLGPRWNTEVCILPSDTSIVKIEEMMKQLICTNKLFILVYNNLVQLVPHIDFDKKELHFLSQKEQQIIKETGKRFNYGCASTNFEKIASNAKKTGFFKWLYLIENEQFKAVDTCMEMNYVFETLAFQLDKGDFNLVSEQIMSLTSDDMALRNFIIQRCHFLEYLCFIHKFNFNSDTELHGIICHYRRWIDLVANLFESRLGYLDQMLPDGYIKYVTEHFDNAVFCEKDCISSLLLWYHKKLPRKLVSGKKRDFHLHYSFFSGGSRQALKQKADLAVREMTFVYGDMQNKPFTIGIIEKVNSGCEMCYKEFIAQDKNYGLLKLTPNQQEEFSKTVSKKYPNVFPKFEGKGFIEKNIKLIIDPDKSIDFIHLLGASIYGSYTIEVEFEYKNGKKKRTLVGLSDWYGQALFGERIGYIITKEKSGFKKNGYIWYQTIKNDVPGNVVSVYIKANPFVRIFAVSA